MAFLASLSAAAVAGCAHAQPGYVNGAPATFTYTCCSAGDVDQVIHPGEVFQLHWIVLAGPPSPAAPTPIALSAFLTGPHTDTTDVKTAFGDGVPASPTMEATPVHTTSNAGEAPISRIVVPPDAAPGLYDLSTVVESAGGTLSGKYVIRVEAQATP